MSNRFRIWMVALIVLFCIAVAAIYQGYKKLESARDEAIQEEASGVR